MSMYEQFGEAVANQSVDNTSTKVTFTFKALPKSLEDLESIPQSAMKTPFMTAALTVMALCQYSQDSDSGNDILNYLRGPRTVTEHELKFINERLAENKRIPFSYLKGANSENDFTPSSPYCITVYETQNSYANEGYAQIFVDSSFDHKPHQITLRWRNDQWLLWDQYLLVGLHK